MARLIRRKILMAILLLIHLIVPAKMAQQVPLVQPELTAQQVPLVPKASLER